MRIERLLFEVDGTPKPEPRPRAVIRRGRYGKRADVFVPNSADQWKMAVRKAALDALGLHIAPREPLWNSKHAIKATLIFRFKAPKSGKWKNWHNIAPDGDNLEKAVLDALGPWPKGHRPIAWADDKIVCWVERQKTRSIERPGLRILLEELKP